jgi:hypothetical protein
MRIATLEGIVEKGQIRFTSDLRLPDKTKVYVVISNIQIENVAYSYTPRLANPSQSADFKMEVLEKRSG